MPHAVIAFTVVHPEEAQAMSMKKLHNLSAGFCAGADADQFTSEAGNRSLILRGF
jgi:hypothetical protein